MPCPNSLVSLFPLHTQEKLYIPLHLLVFLLLIIWYLDNIKAACHSSLFYFHPVSVFIHYIILYALSKLTHSPTLRRIICKHCINFMKFCIFEVHHVHVHPYVWVYMCICVCARTCGVHVLWHKCGGKRTSFWNQSSPFII